jgi:glycine/D-amino acid oxidase-like deaminating enzyme
MVFDYLILGQGISGSFLSWYLLQAGKKVLVIDEDSPYTASKVASGVINPVTGKRSVRTWLAETFLPFADVAYRSFEGAIESELITTPDILQFHPSGESRDIFNSRVKEGETYLEPHYPDGFLTDTFRFNYGVGRINSCRLVDVSTLIGKWRQKLSENGSLIAEKFDWEQLQVSTDQVKYKGISAEKIICCEGVEGYNNPYFKMLPWSRNKGEALIVSIPGLSPDYIYKQGISIVPWQDDLFWIGSSYDWNYVDVQPSTLFSERVETQLEYWLKVPYKFVDHIASERPATVGQRPFVGTHPLFPALAILNGMGSKGCSLAPYFAWQLFRHLTINEMIEPEVDVRRFSRILSR